MFDSLKLSILLSNSSCLIARLIVSSQPNHPSNRALEVLLEAILGRLVSLVEVGG